MYTTSLLYPCQGSTEHVQQLGHVVLDVKNLLQILYICMYWDCPNITDFWSKFHLLLENILHYQLWKSLRSVFSAFWIILFHNLRAVIFPICFFFMLTRLFYKTGKSLLLLLYLSFVSWWIPCYQHTKSFMRVEHVQRNSFKYGCPGLTLLPLKLFDFQLHALCFFILWKYLLSEVLGCPVCVGHRTFDIRQLGVSAWCEWCMWAADACFFVPGFCTNETLWSQVTRGGFQLLPSSGSLLCCHNFCWGAQCD